MPSDHHIDQALRTLARHRGNCDSLRSARSFFSGLLAVAGWWRPAHYVCRGAIALLDRGLRRRGCEEESPGVDTLAVPARDLVDMLEEWRTERADQDPAAAAENAERAAAVIEVLHRYGIPVDLGLLEMGPHAEEGERAADVVPAADLRRVLEMWRVSRRDNPDAGRVRENHACATDIVVLLQAHGISVDGGLLESGEMREDQS